MKEKISAWVMLIYSDICIALSLWVVMITMKSVGCIGQDWEFVLSSLVWIVWLVGSLSVLVFGILRLILALKRYIRRRRTDRRIIRQAKALGVWGNPKVLGGRALEIYAREWYNLKRLPGETDKELRRRCMVDTDTETEKREG